ncbi:MAG: glycosyltransferase [Thermofilaceae archaeon]
MNSKNSKSIAYITPFDPRSYRRPYLVKRALPFASIYYYRKIRDSNWLLCRVLRLNNRLSRVELRIYQHTRSGGDALVTALVTDVLNKALLARLKADTVITLNPFLGSRRIWGSRVIIIDWMDVHMWPWDELNLFDIEAVEEADGVIFWSRPLLEIMKKRLKLRNYTYVPHGIDLGEFDPTKVNPKSFRNKYRLGDSFLVAYSGGVWSYRGVDLQGVRKVIEAVALASRQLPNLKLVLQLGRVDLDLIHFCKKLRVLDKTRIIGPLPYSDPERLGLFAAADVLVAPNSAHPSVYYAERIKFFHYMAAGRAILAEKTPGAISVFGNTAYYVELDDVEALADAIVELHDDCSLRNSLGKLARERVTSLFEWNVIAPRLKDFVNNILKEQNSY